MKAFMKNTGCGDKAGNSWNNPTLTKELKMAKQKQKVWHLEVVWQKSDAPGYAPYAIRYAWCDPETPEYMEHKQELSLMGEQRMRFEGEGSYDIYGKTTQKRKGK